MALDSCYDCCVLPPPLGWDCDWDLRTLTAGDADAAAAREGIHDWELRTLAAGDAAARECVHDWELRTLAAGDAAAREGVHDWELRIAAGDAAAAAREGIHHDDDFFAAMCVESPASSEASSISGYLEDAVAHWSDRCKRQRMASPPQLPRCPATVNEEDIGVQCLLQTQSSWDSVSGDGDLLHDSKMTTLSEEEGGSSGREQEQEGQRSAAQEEAGPPPPPCRFPAATGQLQKATTGEPARHRSSSNYGENELPSSSPLAGKENAGYGVLCPFQFVKPMGLEGGGTTALKDVNQRILKRPARPVRHPVGRFAFSAAVSASGVGLSGKAVVSITRIRTGGKGTITIIRTRG